MKRILIVSGLLFSSLLAISQKRPYNVVFDVTSNDTSVQRSVLRWVSGILKADPSAKLEVVMYGHGIDLVLNDQAYLPDIVKTLAASPQVQFNVCAVALKAHNHTTADLLPGVKTVPDGIYEIISRQADGWGYIKVAH